MNHSAPEPETCTVLDPGTVRWIGAVQAEHSWTFMSLEFESIAGQVQAWLSIPSSGLRGRLVSEVRFRSCHVSFGLADPAHSLSFEGKFRDGTISGSVAGSVAGSFKCSAGAGKLQTGAFHLVQTASDSPNSHQHQAGIYGQRLDTSILIGAYEDHLNYLVLPSGESEELFPQEMRVYRSRSGILVGFAAGVSGSPVSLTITGPGVASESKPLLYPVAFGR